MTPRKAPPLVKLLIDAGPLVAFVIAYWRADLMTATAVIMGATLIALIASYAIERRIALMPLISFGFIAVFGGLTLLLHNDTIIKMKPTFAYLMFAVALLGGLAVQRPLLKPLFEMSLHLTDEGWRILTLRWGIFFIVMAILNEIVWRNFPENVWVALKGFGFLPLTMVFALAQIPLIRSRALPDAPKSS